MPSATLSKPLPVTGTAAELHAKLIALRFQIYSDLKDPVILSMHIDDKRSDPPPGDRYDTQPAYIVPARYDDPKTSNLTATIEPGAERVVDLVLTSNPTP